MIKKILLIAGTRPNFIKLAPLYHKLKNINGLKVEICHTGQHYDKNMSDIFWQLLELPAPNYKLNARGKNVPEIIGQTILKLSPIIQNGKFDLIIVVGDVNATVAGAITGVQSRQKVMHIEAGLRSGDRTMPEEINRIITDHVSDFLMVSEPSGLENLKKEGISNNKIFFVGNIMIECLIMFRNKWEMIVLPDNISERIKEHDYYVCTFHRPENVDTKEDLIHVIRLLEQIPIQEIIILPLHPRTKNNLEKFNLLDKLLKLSNMVVTPPLSYFEFIKLVSKAKIVMTDSGGIQEETSFLGVPCITFRNNTERPITLDNGTNQLVNIKEIAQNKMLKPLLKKTKGKTVYLPKWDAQVSNRIKNIIVSVQE